MNPKELSNHLNQAKDKASSVLMKMKQQKKRYSSILAAALLSGLVVGGVKQCSKDHPQNKEKTEIQYKKNTYWQGEQWDSKMFPLQKEKLADGVHIIRDQGMTFYIVQKGDNLINIIKKLSKLEEFSYLQDESYIPRDGSRNLQSFNIPAKALQAGMYIPIPLAREQRETDDQEFFELSLQAIDELSEDSNYGEAIKEILKSVSKEEIAKTMCAYARSETAQDWKDFSDKIGSATLHRREPHMHAFSFSHYHILMEKNADGKTPGPGLKARLNLGLSEGQTYHPKNGGKLFLAYWIEKNKSLKKENKIDFSKMLNMKDENDAKKYGKIYNGSSEYGAKLWANYQYYQQKFHTQKQ